MIWYVTVGSRTIAVTRENGAFLVEGQRIEARLVREAGHAAFHLVVDGTDMLLGLDGHAASGWRIVQDGTLHEVRVEDERTRELRSRAPAPMRTGGPAVIKAPMPGLVVRVLVHEGEHVNAGAGVVVLEAMKMENELKAPRSGVVQGLRVAPGQTVEKGAVLLQLGE